MRDRRSDPPRRARRGVRRDLRRLPAKHRRTQGRVPAVRAANLGRHILHICAGRIREGTASQRGEFHDLSEPVRRVIWVPERPWVVCVGKRSSFSVLDPVKMKSILLCSGHNSPIVDVIYLNGLLHSRCESSAIYSWNIDGQLVSKRKSKRMKRIGQFAAMRAPAISTASRPSAAARASGCRVFSRIVPLVMPNCQTFAVVLNVLEFLNGFTGCPELPLRHNRPSCRFMLWKLHVGEGKLAICDEMGLLSSFTVAVAGDNSPATLPISRRAPPHSKADLLAIDPLINIRSHVAFEFSSLLSAIHAVGRCFAELRGDEGCRLCPRSARQ
jgi:hypothetical protein